MTTTLDRITPPPVGAFPPLVLPEPQRYRLTNGIEVTACNLGDEEVCRVDLMFDGGYYADIRPGTASLTLLMLKEGAAGKSSEAIAEAFDYHGAWLQTTTSSHYQYVTLYTLNRHLDTCIGLLADIVTSPDFPQPEFDRLKERRIQQLLVQNEKVDSLASDTFLAQIFGSEHPYGRIVTPAHLERIVTDDLRAYHRQHIRPDRCHIFVAGKVTDRLLDNLEHHFGQTWQGPADEPTPDPVYPIEPASQHIAITHKEHALQSGIRLGLPVINRDHPDFFALKLLCTALGGYFGSRLMSNIREEKGYTYGISSSVAAMRYGSYLVISTQTGTEFTRPLIDEVFAEIERLRHEPIPADELTVVKNYLRGDMARTLDSPFSIADYYLSLQANDLTTDYFAQQDEAIRRLTANDLLEAARRYLEPDRFYIAVAGDREKIPELSLPR